MQNNVYAIEIHDNADYKPELKVNSFGNGGPVLHLWHVTLTLTRKDKMPLVTMAYVLAGDEASAISQVSEIAMGSDDAGWITALHAMKEGTLTGTAHVLPFYIQGWGVATF